MVRQSVRREFAGDKKVSADVLRAAMGGRRQVRTWGRKWRERLCGGPPYRLLSCSQCSHHWRMPHSPHLGERAVQT